MKVILLLILGLMVSCSMKVNIQTTTGVQEKEFGPFEVKNISTVVDKIEELGTEVETNSCDISGVCCKCGFTLSMKHECSCGFWRNCKEGTRSQQLIKKKVTYHEEYSVESNGKKEVYKTPSSENIRKEYGATSACKQN